MLRMVQQVATSCSLDLAKQRHWCSLATVLTSPSQDLQLLETKKLSVPCKNPSRKVTNSKGKEKIAYPAWISALLCLSHWILLERKYIKEDKQKDKLAVSECYHGR